MVEIEREITKCNMDNAMNIIFFRYKQFNIAHKTLSHLISLGIIYGNNERFDDLFQRNDSKIKMFQKKKSYKRIGRLFNSFNIMMIQFLHLIQSG